MIDNYSDLISFLDVLFGEGDQITLDTSLEEDLGITGEEAEELIVKFSIRFVVNIDQFHFSKYFYPEPPSGVLHPGIKRLTVGHLLNAIEAGRLDEEIINS